MILQVQDADYKAQVAGIEQCAKRVRKAHELGDYSARMYFLRVLLCWIDSPRLMVQQGWVGDVGPHI